MLFTQKSIHSAQKLLSKHFVQGKIQKVLQKSIF